jgi:hypothetical protein
MVMFIIIVGIQAYVNDPTAAGFFVAKDTSAIIDSQATGRFFTDFFWIPKIVPLFTIFA